MMDSAEANGIRDTVTAVSFKGLLRTELRLERPGHESASRSLGVREVHTVCVRGEAEQSGWGWGLV